MVNYPVGDFLIQIKNAARAHKRDFSLQKTKFIIQVAEALKRARYLDEVVVDGDNLNIKLSLYKKEPVLMDIKLVSKPGLRIYINSDELEARKGASILLITTPKGVLSSKEATKARTGGEVIAEIW